MKRSSFLSQVVRKTMPRKGFTVCTRLLFAICAVALAFAPNAWAGDTVLHNFDASGAGSYSTLVSDEYGNLYGTTLTGGDFNCNAYSACGTVFVLCAPNVSGNSDLYPCTTGNPMWEEHVLHSFAGGNDGAFPYSGLLFMVGSKSRGAFTLYGTTYYGGQSQCNDGVELGCGTVFELCAPHSGGGCGGNQWSERIVHNFTGGKKDGSYPYAGLITDGSGSLYGTTVYGGGGGNCRIEPSSYAYCGTVFMLKGGPPWHFPETIFHRFLGAHPGCIPYLQGRLGCDGANPYGVLCCNTQYGFLYMYGTTFKGGDPVAQAGTVFNQKINNNFPEQVLYDFGVSPDGANPYAGVTLYPKYGGCSLIICLVGTTSAVGPHHGGIAFELSQTASPPWAETVIHAFSDGAMPVAGLIVDGVGNIYGTTEFGGTANEGTVFKLASSRGWPETVLNDFAGSPADGAYPAAGLLFGPVPELYGTTTLGGTNGVGVVYSAP